MWVVARLTVIIHYTSLSHSLERKHFSAACDECRCFSYERKRNVLKIKKYSEAHYKNAISSSSQTRRRESKMKQIKQNKFSDQRSMRKYKETNREKRVFFRFFFVFVFVLKHNTTYPETPDAGECCKQKIRRKKRTILYSFVLLCSLFVRVSVIGYI